MPLRDSVPGGGVRILLLSCVSNDTFSFIIWRCTAAATFYADTHVSFSRNKMLSNANNCRRVITRDDFLCKRDHRAGYFATALCVSAIIWGLSTLSKLCFPPWTMCIRCHFECSTPEMSITRVRSWHLRQYDVPLYRSNCYRKADESDIRSLARNTLCTSFAMKLEADQTVATASYCS